MGESKSTTFKFNLMEFSGSLGDLGLFIPLVVAMTISADLDIGMILILAGVMNILTGLLLKQPIPVQPMKALAVIVITEGMIKEELFAAGILLGVVLIALSFFMDKIVQWVPKVIVRGIQLGVGLKLIAKGVEWISRLPLFNLDSIATAIIVAGILLLFILRKKPGLIFIFLLGFILLYLRMPEVYSMLTFQLPQISFYWPEIAAFKHGFVKGVLPQLPLTLLNSVIALCALSADYFPYQPLKPRKVALSVGLMNLICVPLGGIPMCHGSGGLAAHYRFGARTGGSVIMLGVLKVLVGFLFGGALFMLLQNYPISILGVLLIVAGLELAKVAKDVFKSPRDLILVIVMAGVIVGYNTFSGFLCGCGSYILISMYKKVRS